MRRRSLREREEMMAEHMRRMADPEPYATLRRQKERLEHERQRAIEGLMYDQMAERLRREIIEMGAAPEA